MEQTSMDFSLKTISYFGRQLVIICQNENGPCPLLAISNVLLLEGKINISTDKSMISLTELIGLVVDAILEKTNLTSNPAHNLQTGYVLDVLPKLAQGLDLNVIFDRVESFEFTQEITLFDVLGIRLFHGWLSDPKDESVHCVVGRASYNHLIFKMVEYRTLLDQISPSDDPLSPPAKKDGTALSTEETQLLGEGAVVETFLAQTAPQFTYCGLLKLYENMEDRQLAVFFRNNHFSTIFSFNGQLFVLVTDQGYLHEPSVVWELLSDTDGNTEYYNEEFVPLSQLPSEVFSQQVAYAGATDDDTALCLALSESTIQQTGDTPQGVLSSQPIQQRVSTGQSVDMDLLLAQQLQQQELKAQDAPGTATVNRSSKNTTTAIGDPQMNPLMGQANSPGHSDYSQGATRAQPKSDSYNTAGTTAAVSSVGASHAGRGTQAQDLGMTQEEMDHQHAMMLQFEEKRAMDRLPAAGNERRSSRQRPAGEQTAQAKTKSSSSCVVS